MNENKSTETAETSAGGAVSVDAIVSNFTCYDSNKEVYSQIYDCNGNALQLGEIVELLNELNKKRSILDAVKEASRMCEQSRAKYIYEIVKDC